MKITQILNKIFCFREFTFQHNFFVLAFVLFSVLCLLGRIPRSVILFALSCIICANLIFLCRKKLNGYLYLLFAIIVYNFPAFLIQKSLGKDYAYGNSNEFFKQCSFVLCWIICWNTSHYFPYYDFATFSEKEKKRVVDMTVNISNSGCVNAISFSQDYYDFINGLPLNTNLSLLTWFNRVSRPDFISIEEYFSVIKNPRIKGILVGEYSKYNR